MFSRSISVTVNFASPPKSRYVREQEKLEKQQQLIAPTNPVPQTASDANESRRLSSGAPNREGASREESRVETKKSTPLDPYI